MPNENLASCYLDPTRMSTASCDPCLLCFSFTPVALYTPSRDSGRVHRCTVAKIYRERTSSQGTHCEDVLLFTSRIENGLSVISLRRAYAFLGKWTQCPNASPQASINASESPGWAWIVPAASSQVTSAAISAVGSSIISAA